MMKPASQTVKIVILQLNGMNDTIYKQFYGMVSAERRRRADRCRRQEDAVRCIMAEALVRYAYHSRSSESPVFMYPPNGKPYLQNDRSFHFSVSHTGMLVAVGYADSEIGIDIEQIDRPLDRKSIAGLVFTPKEQAYVFGASDGQTRFLRFTELWTAKESYLKYLGTGFSKSPLSFSVDLKSRTVHEQEGGTVPGITFLGERLLARCYLTACGNIGSMSLELKTYRAIMDIILQ